VTRSDLDRLRDAKAYAQDALHNGGGLEAEILAQAKQPLHAVLFDRVLLGEALGKVPGELRALALDIPWKMATDMRNLIVHAYWQIDLDIVAAVLDRELDPLIQRLDELIRRLEREGG